MGEIGDNGLVEKIAFVTDSAAAMPPELLRTLRLKAAVEVVEIPTYIDDVALSGSQLEIAEAITLAHALGQRIRTAAPAPGEFEEVYEKLMEEGVTHIFSVHLSSALSGTFDSARIAAARVALPIYVLDSQSVAMGYGHVVNMGVELVNQQVPAASIYELLQDLLDEMRVYFYIPVLDALRKGGRINAAMAMLGQMFQIIPVGTIEHGKVQYYARAKSVEQAQEILSEIAKDRSTVQRQVEEFSTIDFIQPPQGKVVAVHYCGNKAEAEKFAQFLKLPEDTILAPLPPVLSAHSGLGALAIVLY